MIETTGRIIAIHDGRADVELAQTTACTSCSSKKSCNSSQEQPGRTQVVTMDAPLHARAGDQVKVSMSSAGLHAGALLAYLLPSLTTVLGALIFSPGGDGPAAAGLIGGLIVGIALVRLASRLLPNLVRARCDTDFHLSH